MKTALGLVIMLVLSTALWSQGEDPQLCQYCYCKATNSCSSSCPNPTSPCSVPLPCASRQFTANCSGNWSLHATLTCIFPSKCEGCKACVYVCDGTTVLGSVSTECG